jgi:hypothetical protein
LRVKVSRESDQVMETFHYTAKVCEPYSQRFHEIWTATDSRKRKYLNG